MVVRPEARCALLAYGYLRGTPYRAMEAKSWHPPDWKKIEKLVAKYGPACDLQAVSKAMEVWRKA